MLADRNKVIIKIIHFRFAVLYTSEQGIIANIANEVLILADTTAEVRNVDCFYQFPYQQELHDVQTRSH